jgi:hypothetical protein
VSPDGRNVYVGGFFSLAVFARDPSTGALRQLPGRSGCLVQRRARTRASDQHCARTHALGEAPVPTVSPDGRNVYTAGDGFVAVFRRDLGGALAQLDGARGCLEYYSRRGCTKARGIWLAQSIALSPDGTSAYVGSGFDVAAFHRNIDGTLDQLQGTDGCLTSDPDEANAEPCAQARGTDASPAPVVTGDGENTYVPSFVCVEADPIADLCNTSSALVASFSRAATGVLTQLEGTGGCLAGPSRLMQKNGCAHARGFGGFDSLRDPIGIVSPDNKNLYVAVPHANTVLALAIG